MLKSIQTLYLKAGLAMMGLMLAYAPSIAFAQTDLRGLTSKVGTQLGGIPLLLSYVVYVVGAVLFIIGLFKLKQHIENPGQAKLGPALGYMVVGVLFLALPWAISIIYNTLGASNTGNVTQPTLQGW